jgi:chromatin remodeling complex protein RSC6
MSADPVPIPASGEIDEALLDPQLFADSEGFDPDTLANLAALSRIANEEDDDVAVGAPEGDSALTGPDAAPGIGVGADELTVPSADRNRRRKSRAQEPELSRDQVRALVEGLSKGDKERRGDAEAGDRAEDEQGDAAARPGSEMKADEDDPRSKEEQLTEVGEADKEDLKDRDYQEEGQDDGKKKRKRKRNRTTLSCTECHRRVSHPVDVGMGAFMKSVVLTSRNVSASALVSSLPCLASLLHHRTVNRRMANLQNT